MTFLLIKEKKIKCQEIWEGKDDWQKHVSFQNSAARENTQSISFPLPWWEHDTIHWETLTPQSHDAAHKKCHVTKPKASRFVPSATSTTRRQSYCTKIWINVSVPAAQWTKKSGQLICTHRWHKFNFYLETSTIRDSPSLHPIIKQL